MLRRVVSQYSKNPPYDLEDEFRLNCESDDMRHLFDTSGNDEGMPDTDMILVYEIKTEEQAKFFKQYGVEIDLASGYYYVECYDE